MFGLPAVTALFLFGGFLLAALLSLGFALRFSADTEDWATLDDFLRRRS